MLEEKYEKFCNGCEKMRNASGHTEVKLSSSLKKKQSEQEHIRQFLFKTCN